MSDLSLAPLSHIKANLDRLFGAGVWANWELETLSLELNLVFDELTRDKISVLQSLAIHPDLFFHDMAFFLHAVEVINNKAADFEHFPMPTSLELAYAIEEAKSLGLPQEVFADPDSDLVDTVAYLLREEGYSVPVFPFEFVPIGRLEQGQTTIDIEAKKKAIELYIEGMNNL